MCDSFPNFVAQNVDDMLRTVRKVVLQGNWQNKRGRLCGVAPLKKKDDDLCKTFYTSTSRTQQKKTCDVSVI